MPVAPRMMHSPAANPSHAHAHQELRSPHAPSDAPPVGQPPEPAFPLPTPHRSILPPSVGHLPLPPRSGLLTLLRPFVPSAPSCHRPLRGMHRRPGTGQAQARHRPGTGQAQPPGTQDTSAHAHTHTHTHNSCAEIDRGASEGRACPARLGLSLSLSVCLSVSARPPHREERPPHREERPPHREERPPSPGGAPPLTGRSAPPHREEPGPYLSVTT